MEMWKVNSDVKQAIMWRITHHPSELQKHREEEPGVIRTSGLNRESNTSEGRNMAARRNGHLEKSIRLEKGGVYWLGFCFVHFKQARVMSEERNSMRNHSP